MRKVYRDKNLQLMFGVTLMIIMGVSSVMPVLPMIKNELHIQARSIGLVVAIFALPGVLLAPIIGILADRVGRKKILVAALLGFGTFGAACAFAPDFRTLLVLRFLQGVGMAPLGVLNATVIGDLYDGAERITAMGYTATVLSVGAALFPAVGGVLALLGWQYPFLLPVTALPLALLVYRSLDNPEPVSAHSFANYLKGAFFILATRRAVALFLLTFFTFILLYGPFVTYLPLVLQERFHLTSAMIGIIVSISSLFTGLAASQLGRISMRVSQLWVLRSSFALFLASMLLIPGIPTLWWILLPLSLFGAAMGLGGPSRITLLTSLASTHQRAAVMSVNSMVQRIGQTVAPVLMGIVFSALGMDSVYWAGAGVALCMIAVTRWLEG